MFRPNSLIYYNLYFSPNYLIIIIIVKNGNLIGIFIKIVKYYIINEGKCMYCSIKLVRV